MANADAPAGFKPLNQADGSPYNGGTIQCVILGADTTNTFIGDAVVFDGTGDALGLYPSVVQVAAGGQITGVVTSVVAEPTDLTLQYAAGATTTDRVVNVALALDNVFEIQEDGVGGAIAVTAIGQACDIVVGTGSTVTGASAMELDSSNAATGDQVILLGISQAADNELGTNARWKVRINETNLRGVGTPI